MPSPFSGMDPYLEAPEFWSEVHNRMIVAIADDISPKLRPRYRVAIAQRIYLSSSETQIVVPDVGLPEKVRKSYLEVREAEPVVVLQEIFNGMYDRAGFDLAIDHRQPIRSLSGEDAVWVEGTVQS